jgi:hypothetical protein
VLDKSPPREGFIVGILLIFLVPPVCYFAANNVVNMSHYDLMRPDFGAMANGTNTNKTG